MTHDSLNLHLFFPYGPPKPALNGKKVDLEKKTIDFHLRRLGSM